MYLEKLTWDSKLWNGVVILHQAVQLLILTNPLSTEKTFDHGYCRCLRLIKFVFALLSRTFIECQLSEKVVGS